MRYLHKNKEEIPVNKSELINALSQKAEFSKKDAEKALNAFVDTVVEALGKGDKVKSPLEHKIERGIAATGEHLRDGEKAEWSSNSIRRILENPVYIGTLVQGKSHHISYKNKKRRKAPKEYKGYIHRVKDGESMYSISQKYGIRLKYLYKMNNLTPEYMIAVGDMLRVR